MELDLRFLLEEQRERKATIREQGTGRPPPSLLLYMTQGEKEGLPALHCTAPAARPRHESCQQKIYTHLNIRTT